MNEFPDDGSAVEMIIDPSVSDTKVIARGDYDWVSTPPGFPPSFHGELQLGQSRKLRVALEQPFAYEPGNQPRKPDLSWYLGYFLSTGFTLATPSELYWFGVMFPKVQWNFDIIGKPFQTNIIPVLSGYRDGEVMRRSLSYIREPREGWSRHLRWRFLIREL